MSNHGELSTIADQLGVAALVRPQRHGEAPGRVGGDDDLAVPVALGDPPPGQVDLGEVLVEVGDVVGGLVLAQRPAVLAEVDGVERVAAIGPPPGVLAVEEVVGETVHVEDGATVGTGRLEGDERGDDGALVVGWERDGLDPVVGSEDVVLRAAPEACGEPIQRGRRVSLFGLRAARPGSTLQRCRTRGDSLVRGVSTYVRQRVDGWRTGSRGSQAFLLLVLLGLVGRGPGDRRPHRGRRAGVPVVPLPDARHDAAALRPAAGAGPRAGGAWPGGRPSRAASRPHAARRPS